jgi:uncharacterized protein YbdZ (MbtH family)
MRNRNRRGDDMTKAPHYVVVNDEDQYPLRPSSGDGQAGEAL